MDYQTQYKIMGRKRINHVYNLFTKIGTQSQCTLCKKQLRTHHGSNLLRHIKSFHEKEFNDIKYLNSLARSAKARKRPASQSSGEETSQTPRDFFTEQSDGSWQCVLCQVSVSEEELQEHLQEEHSPSQQVQKLEKEDSDHDIFTEVIYLDDEIPQNKKPKTSFKTETPTPLRKKFRVRSFYENSNEMLYDEQPVPTKAETPKKQTTQPKANDEIDIFTTYVGTLLRGMPKHVSTKVQMQILNYIMQEKLNLENGETVRKSDSFVMNVKPVSKVTVSEASTDTSTFPFPVVQDNYLTNTSSCEK